jgi:AcrR family transcriptional regulator
MPSETNSSKKNDRSFCISAHYTNDRANLSNMNRLASTDDRPRGRADGTRSRIAILDAAAALATVDGLDGLSIGDLARHTGMSKSGLYAHFKSKEELQLATIGHAADIFEADVVRPAQATGDGLRRLWALSEAYLAHLERRVFPGGCFFAAVGAEFDSRPGRVRESIAAFAGGWMSELTEAVREAREAGELDPTVEPEQLAYETNALLLMAHATFAMSGDTGVFDRTRRGLERLLGERPRRPQ